MNLTLCTGDRKIAGLGGHLCPTLQLCGRLGATHVSILRINRVLENHGQTVRSQELYNRSRRRVAPAGDSHLQSRIMLVKSYVPSQTVLTKSVNQFGE
jgi:hypothetical protein